MINSNVRKTFLFLIFFIFPLILPQAEVKDKKKPKSNQTRLVEFAGTFLGKKTYSKTVVRDRTFMLDCIGFVSAVYYGIGIDIKKDFSKYGGNGVSRLFQSLKYKGMIYRDKLPAVGDVIFWDHSWDKNNDGVMGNDTLTHAGIVMKIDTDGTIHYIHANYVYGIVIETMNLKYPKTYKDASGKVVNSVLALGSSIKKHPVHWLSGDMWNAYGIVLQNKNITKNKK